MKAIIKAALVATLTLVCIERNAVWRDDAALWRDSLEKAPYKARGYNELALTAIQSGDYRTALEAFTRALRLSPYLPQAYTNIGLAYEGLNQLDMAIFAYQKAMSMTPDDPTPFYNLGVLYYTKMHDREKAFGLFLQARDINPFEPDVHQYLGFIYRDKGNSAQALEEFKLYNELK